MGYPWQACIESMLGFCNEVIVVDGGSSDDTWAVLEDMVQQQDDDRLKIHQHKIDEDGPSFAYESDGKLKARSRDLCTMEYCWQMDADEVVHEEDYEKIIQLMRNFPKLVDVVTLPLIEYWGSKEKVRIDVNPCKWRLSKNLPHITQGIPAELRKFDEDDNEYADWGTDTCDYIHKETRERLPVASFYTEEIHNARGAALQGNEKALEMYEGWFNFVVEQLPTVHHYSWMDISTKIKQYKKHWGKFWKSQYRLDEEDTAENNVMFNKPWVDVTDDDIDKFAARLSTEMGGWIFHQPVDFSTPTPHVQIKRGHPAVYIKNEQKSEES
jgi:glycosyltransferase involved in cell wall biosynthesis